MKIIVTGGAGFIGSNFVRMSVARGHRVVVLDALTYAGHKENLDGIIGTGDFEFVKADIGDKRAVTKLFQDFKPNYLFNFAAESHVDRSIDGPSIFITTNVLGTSNLLDCSLEYWKSLDDSGKKLFRYLQVSTDEVYGALGDIGKFSETTPYSPNSPYSASKAGADHLVRAWHHTFGLPTITTNCSNNYGPYQFPEKLIPTMIRCALAEQPLPVYGKGGNIRDWIQVEDHCNGIWLAMDRGRPGETYCFGGNAERNNLDVVKSICREMDQLIPRANGRKYEELISFVTDRLGHDWRYAIDDSKATKELGFKRKYNFEDGLKHTVRWYFENQAWMRQVMSKSRKSG
ncbi:MAG: dTDP-glucose 4,6-dehydratase [Proteobacteria bacterium SG_bin7]|nr:MAG: dTDP-glucose 4,6-dehydratase [Proteobacteria bacterium SG_bin7]